jgi:hypothetical protein
LVEGSIPSRATIFNLDFFTMKSKQVEELVLKLIKYRKEWGEYPRLDFLVNGEAIRPDLVSIHGFSSKCTVELDIALDEEECKFLKSCL